MIFRIKKSRLTPAILMLASLAAPAASRAQTQTPAQKQTAADPAAACACEASPLPKTR